MTANSTTEPNTPAAEPEKTVGDRWIAAAWNVGPADEKGYQRQARLLVFHWQNSKCYDAKLRVGRVKRQGAFATEELNYNALMRYEVIVEQQAATRFNRKTLGNVYETALARLRSRFENGEDAVRAYFDPTSDKHAA